MWNNIKNPQLPSTSYTTYAVSIAGTSEDMEMPGNEYKDCNFVRGLFPHNWNIVNIDVVIEPMTSITLTVVRQSSAIGDIRAGIPEQLKHFLNRINCSWTGDRGSFVQYEFSVSHEFYCKELPEIHKEVFDSQFHKDFEDTANQK